MITYPLNNIDYTAEDAELFHCTRKSGIWANDSFSISVTGLDNNVAIGTGIAWINNEKFSGKVAALKSARILDLGIADSAYPRIDVIAIQFNANNNATDIVVKKGVASTNPTRPAISRTATVYELYLASIYRPAASTVVTSNNVTDLRLDESVCGLMSDSVTKIDTGAINAQVLALIGSLNAEIESVKNASGIMLTADYDPDNDRVFAVSNGGTGANTAAGARTALGLGSVATENTLPISKGGTGSTSASGARTNLGLDGKLFTQYALNSINIDSTGGNWTVDISETGHGAIPMPWVNVTQTTGAHFIVQVAIKCDTSQSTSGRDQRMWIRDRYSSGVWSNWKEVLTENRGVQMVKLWENTNLSASFGSQDVSLPTDYNFYAILYSRTEASTENTFESMEFVRVQTGRQAVLEHNDDGVVYQRELIVGAGIDGFISFSSAYKTGTATIKNTWLVPMFIYGIKGVL